MRRGAGRIAAALLAVAAFTGCDEDDESLAPAPVAVAGIWEQVAGAYLLEPRDDIAETGNALYLQLDDGVTGSLQIRDWTNGIVVCSPVLYAVAAPRALILDAEDWSGIYKIDRTDSGTMTLADAQGHESVFALRGAMPDSMRCGEIDVVHRFDLPDSVSPGSGLAFDGAYLWFTASRGDELYAVDPDKGEIAAVRPVMAAAAPVVAGAEGADLWRLCACNLGEDPAASRIWRVAPDESIRDEVDTAALTSWSRVLAVASDPATGFLWTHRHSFPMRPEFVVIDVAAEPDQLVFARDISFFLTEMWWRTEIIGFTIAEEGRWGVAEIDIETFKVSRSYTPLPGLDLFGVTVAGDRVFLLASPERESQAVVLEVRLEWPGP